MRTKDLWLQKEEDILEVASLILRKRLERVGHVRDPGAAKDYLKAHLSGKPNEVFGCFFLDTRHSILGIEDLFFGTVDGAEVHPRVVAKRALELNATAVICFHNHPSGNPEPSASDRAVTARLKQALALLDVRLLDHFIVAGEDITSLASRGWV